MRRPFFVSEQNETMFTIKQSSFDDYFIEGDPMLGYDFFYARGGMFTRYAHNREAWVKLKYNF